MINVIRISAAVVLIVGAGIVNGSWTNRWGPSPALTALASRFESVPMVIGDWKATSFELGPGERAMAGAVACLSRVYTNPRRGVSVSVLLLGGLPGQDFHPYPRRLLLGRRVCPGIVLAVRLSIRRRRRAAREIPDRRGSAGRNEPVHACGSSGAGTPRRAGPRPRSRAGRMRPCLPSANSTSSEKLPGRSSIPAPILATSSSLFFCRKSTGSCFLTRSDFDDETHSKWRGLLE